MTEKARMITMTRPKEEAPGSSAHDAPSSNRGEEGMIKNAAALADKVNNYCRWNLSVFPIQKNKRILDIGCGPCAYLDALLTYDPEFYLATDYSERFLDVVRKRMSGLSKCRAEKLDIFSAPGSVPFLEGEKFDYVLCFDVIEHLEDDVEGLKNIRRIMAMTGARELFVRVPALPLLFGSSDEAIGHFRRYTKNSLRSAFEAAGFELRRIKYQNIAGVIPWFVIGRLFRRSLAVAPSEGRLFDMIVPLLKWIEVIVPPPIGLTLYCEAIPKDYCKPEGINRA